MTQEEIGNISGSLNVDEIEILKRLAEAISSLSNEMAVLTGTKVTVKVSSTDIEELKQTVIAISKLQTEIQYLMSCQPTPIVAKNILRDMNRLYRLIIPGIPRNRKPMEWLVERIKQTREVPKELQVNFPAELNYAERHQLLLDFIDELTSSVEKTVIDDFLQRSIDSRKIVVPCQRLFQNVLLPPVLKTPPRNLSLKSTEKLKLALHNVINDWEPLVNLTYGFYVMKEGRTDVNWTNVQKESLWNKVCTFQMEPTLSKLVKQDWVTVRNAFAHGSCYFHPNEQKVVFPDRRKECSWTLQQCVYEARDIYLSNLAMLHVPNFIGTAGIQTLEAQLNQFSQLAKKTQVCE